MCARYQDVTVCELVCWFVNHTCALRWVVGLLLGEEGLWIGFTYRSRLDRGR